MQKIFILLIVLLVFCRCSDHDRPAEKEITPQNTEQKRPDSVSSPKVSRQPAPDPAVARKKFHQHHKKQQKSVREDSIPSHIRDSVRLVKISWLRENGIQIDMNEPGSKRFIFNGINDITDHPFSIVSREKFLKINFDNDILDNTDHFYTNGMRLDLVTSSMAALPFRYLMLPYHGHGINYYGIALLQNMYTPSTTKVGGILQGDRPYAAYLCFSYYKITNDPRKMKRQTSDFYLGVIGPSSGGDFVQTQFHKSVPTNNEPLGWQYQIQNDLVLDYSLNFEKGLVSSPRLELNITGGGELGTLYTHLHGGFLLRTGLMNPYFSNLWVLPADINRKMGFYNTQVFFFLKANAQAVGYDATLQGGMFNHSSVYTKPADQISRFMFNGSAGLTVSHGGMRLDIEQFLLSPEFQKGWWHKWVHIGLTFCL
ncbi:MAG: lipid A deacylase LpxR family protein [Syntrophothermus sp.]